jgi:hypothetical protein
MRRLLVLFLLAACVPLPSPRPRPEEGHWKEERLRWTRKFELYDRLDSRAFAVATYQSPAVRVARATRLAEWKGLSRADTDALLAQEKAEGDRYDDFFLGFFAADTRQNDLVATDTVWRVALVLPNGAQVLPEKIEQLPNDVTVHALYPYLGDFYIPYRIRFPKKLQGDEPSAFVLRLAGAVGKLDVDWASEPIDPTPPARI